MRNIIFIVLLLFAVLLSCKHYEDKQLVGFWVDNSKKDYLDSKYHNGFYFLEMKKDGTYEYGGYKLFEAKDRLLESRGTWSLSGDNLVLKGHDSFGEIIKEMDIITLNDSILVAVSKLDTLRYEKYDNDTRKCIRKTVHKMLDEKYPEKYPRELVDILLD